MKRKLISILATTFTILSVVALAGCAAGQTGPASSTPSAQSPNAGTVQMWVTDAPRSDNVTEIWVTASEVKIHKAGTGQQTSDNGSNEAEGQIDDTEDTGDWISANLTGPNRFDLLTLRGENGGLQQILATASLAAGQYTQIRMTIQKVEVKINGVLKEATLPSGKLKFVHPFTIEANKDTKLLFDFDADKSVNVTGSPKDPKIMVKPVVKMIVSKPQGAQAAQAGVKITTTSLPDGSVGASYNVTLTAIGGTLPYTWNLQGGNLPSGLSLSSAGIISGTPGAGTAGSYSFTVKVSDNSTPVKNDTEHFSVRITGG